MRALSTKFETILNTSFDGIYITDGAGKTLWVNKAAERLCRTPASELIGKHVRELEIDGIFNPSVALMCLQERRQVTTIQDTKSGRRALVTATPVFDAQGNIEQVICNSRDITELTYLSRHLDKAEKMVERYRDELQELRQAALVSKDIVVASETMKEVLKLVGRVASVDATVLLLGESGVGKNEVAKFIHQNSSRKDGPWIEINCGAIPENLLESELFGYVDGAFTGARRRGKIGLIELAHKGTLFLNEIGELPMSMQVKLLEVIQERRLKRVGATTYNEVDFRLIAATNQDLAALIQKGQFREDLYYRLNVVPVEVPPLRERPEDVIPLLLHYVKVFNERYGLSKTMSSECMQALLSHAWPGNVRELRNIAERLVITAESDTIDVRDLPPEYRGSPALPTSDFATEGKSLRELVSEFEATIVQRAVEKLGSTHRAAAALQTSQSTIVRKLKNPLS